MDIQSFHAGEIFVFFRELMLFLKAYLNFTMDSEENNKSEVPEPFKSDNPKAKLSNQQKLWLIIFSAIAAVIYTLINIS